MRVCTAHRIQAVETLKSVQDDSEYDLCPECLEAIHLIISGAFFAEDTPKQRGKHRKEAST